MKKSSVLFLIRLQADLILLCAAWALAFVLRFYSGILPVPKGIPDPILYLKMVPFIAGIWLAVFTMGGFYRRTGHHRSPFVEALDIIQSCLLATLCFIAFSYFYQEYRFSRLVLLLFAVMHPAMIIFGRSMIRKAVRLYRRNAPKRRTLLIGGGETLEQAWALTQSKAMPPMEISTVIPVGELTQKAREGLKSYRFEEIPEDWPKFLSNHHIQSAVIGVPGREYKFIEEHLPKIIDQVTDIQLVPDVMKYARLGSGLVSVDGIPMISMHESPLEGHGHVMKRLLDIVGGMAMLLLFGPIMLLISMVVPLTSRGPVFYRQERMGLDGRTFRIYKFRSMPVDAERTSGPVWAKPKDNRPTVFGKFLRKSGFDELPQIFNILRGEMSLVGPRPERPMFVEEFRQQIPGYMLRHKVKAGLTGWAQVNGWRGETSLERRIECDLFYIQHWSLWFDIRIILLTAVRGFFGRNAY